MPDRETQNAPVPEPLTLRLLRASLDKGGTPLHCPRRQCRRSRHCSGAARRPAEPLTPEEWLPPCFVEADPAARRLSLDMAGRTLPPLEDIREPRAWPTDVQTATHLRVQLAIMQRIHARPGPHPDHERAALAAWQATDPDPEATAHCRRLWRHSKPGKRPAAKAGAAVQPVTQTAPSQAPQGAHA